MNEVKFEVRGQPKGKGRPRSTRIGVTYTPAATRKYEGYVKLCAAEAMGGRPPFSGPVDLQIVAVLPISKSWSKAKKAQAEAGLLYMTKRPDIDNYAKAVMDACNAVVYGDDVQVVSLAIVKRYGPVPMIAVKAREIAP